MAALGLDTFDLAGFSLGARTAVAGIVDGLSPRRLVLGGMGLEGLSGWDRRAAFFIDAIDRFGEVEHGDPAFMAVQFMKTMKVDREAAALLLESFADAKDQWLDAFTMPTLVLLGSEDRDNGSGEALAKALPNATYEEVPGTHMSSVTKPQLGEAIARFLSA